MRVPGYDYEGFCRGVAERDGTGCWVRGLLVARRAGVREKWASGQGRGTHAGDLLDWVPSGLLRCDGGLDGHHLLPKQWLKDEFPFTDESKGEGWVISGTCPCECHRIDAGPIHYDVALYPSCVHCSLADLLNDPRNGVPCCNRHHNMLERHLIVVRRGDIPAHVEEFAAELGDRAVARLERDYGFRDTETSVPSRSREV